MNEMIEIMEHALEDSLPMLPVLFIAYFILEIYEHRSNEDSEYVLLKKYGPLFGSFLGIIPQCGVSIVAATMFLDKKITIGTLISIFIVTSDEAVPILLANPELYGSILQLIVVKVIVAIAVGYFVDAVFKQFKMYNGKYTTSKSQSCDTHESTLVAALKHTVKIFGFILLVNLLLTFVLHEVGEDTLSKVLLTDTVFQPVIAALFGFIPNCAASVVLTQLFASGILSFGALSAGLITNAGLGLLILLRYRIDKKYFLFIISVLFVAAILTGSVLSFF
ncbi:hypothetical protein M2475_001572 [Breznakia sp. PF5-3]|uniref:putative manganese transporter n=1 Tax=unclassified Breznakia TaxID=2623764 RepID=UPI002404C2C3|nr:MULTISPECIES: putative manganese transporter [unclassified Breznakia]MDL2276645.1 arsenic efflux protein [Breznakia sp. OttesenSCG-928-G09]MDF9825143.1 hypothetical protein [Breznakia sp. PM6-1]MDF9835998.1 hypothetical protein [Breznakia sp. PF5-3]MDF9838096.1 hypothetical protein [Breznakia sp. PFB2-8]MDF9860074.1 hypothetical protein [Breznakia sp. PH5-24]